MNEFDSEFIPISLRCAICFLFLSFFFFGSVPLGVLDEHRCPLVMWKHIAHVFTIGVFTHDYLRNLKADYT